MASDLFLSPDVSHQSLHDFSLVVRLPIQWGEQDAFGHVNNVSYLHWCDTARAYYLERIGLKAEVNAEGLGPIVASVHCNYRRPVCFPGIVQVGSRVTKIGNSSFRMEHVVVSEDLDLVVADVDSTLVVVDYRSVTSVPVPKRVRQAIAALEGRALDS
jgi:acyl-CoA thioester hydrolase